MLRGAIRGFASTVSRAAETVAQMERPNQYGIAVSRAQGVVDSFTGG